VRAVNTPASAQLSAPEHLWFFDTLVCVRSSVGDAREGISLLEHRAPHGDSPPLHVHRTEDEIFYVLEGELRFTVDGTEHRAGPGAALAAPRGVPHTYRVESPAGARWLTVTQRGDFERFVRQLGRPADHDGLPTRGRPPTDAEVAELVRIAAAHEIEFCGPPLGAEAPR
jgi:uncharacterized cupin superfamily protein